MVKKEDAEFLKQLGSSLEKAARKLEEAYEKNSYEDFSKLKKFILGVQKNVAEIIQ